VEENGIVWETLWHVGNSLLICYAVVTRGFISGAIASLRRAFVVSAGAVGRWRSNGRNALADPTCGPAGGSDPELDRLSRSAGAVRQFQASPILRNDRAELSRSRLAQDLFVEEA
jgi:hypothetical protein